MFFHLKKQKTNYSRLIISVRLTIKSNNSVYSYATLRYNRQNVSENCFYRAFYSHLFTNKKISGLLMAVYKPKKDWVTKNAPWRVVNAFVKKQGWKVEKGIDPEGKGWLVKRLA